MTVEEIERELLYLTVRHRAVQTMATRTARYLLAWILVLILWLSVTFGGIHWAVQMIKEAENVTR